MKRLLFLFIVILFVSSCSFDKLMIKQIVFNNVTLSWYRESYLTTTRAFVSLKINNVENIVLSNDDINITDVDLKEDTVLIHVNDMKNAGMYGQKNKVGRYSIVLKKSTYYEWWRHYHPGERFYPLPKGVRDQ